MNIIQRILIWFKNLKMLVKVLFVVGSILIVAMLIYGVFLAIPHIVIILLLIIVILDQKNDMREENKVIEAQRQQIIQWNLENCYTRIAELLLPILKEYSKELGIRVNTINSMFKVNEWHKKNKDGITFFIHRLQSNGEPEYSLEEIRMLIQERINQQLYDIPIWIAFIVRHEGGIEVVSTFIDCVEMEQYRQSYEVRKKKSLYNDNKITSSDDKDF